MNRNTSLSGSIRDQVKTDPTDDGSMIGVSGAQQHPLHAVPHGLPSETSRRGTRGGTRGRTSADIKKIDLNFKIRPFLETLY